VAANAQHRSGETDRQNATNDIVDKSGGGKGVGFRSYSMSFDIKRQANGSTLSSEKHPRIWNNVCARWNFL